MIKKIFIVTPRGGLCNQLVSITKGIIYANYFNRDIHFNGFQLNYNNHNEYIDCDKVLNFNILQYNINKLNLSVNILDSVNYEYNYKVIENLSLSITDLYDIIKIDDNIDILNIGNLLNVNLPPILNYHSISKILYISLEFTDYYITYANNIKKNLNLTDYACIHLRLEDDANDFFSNFMNLDVETYNKKLIDNYLIELENTYKNYKKIYICSSLGIQNNCKNDFYKEIKEKYSLIDKNNFLQSDNIIENRELCAIIDFIIARDSIYFVGYNLSSFSNYIYNILEVNKKPCKLIFI
jgi:hypothetical protein